MKSKYTVAFWTKLEEVIGKSSVEIDRPKGSAHPRYPDATYPLDYGFLRDTKSGDGEEIDVWIGSDKSRLLGAIVCCVDSLKRDVEIKLLLGCTAEETELIHAFHSEGDQKAILVVREEFPCPP